MKRCCVCKIYKEEECFYKNRSTKTGLEYECKLCKKKRNKDYVSRNHKKVKAKSRKYYKENKTEIIKKINEWKFERDGGLYRRYWGMVSRCKYKSNSRYKDYGGRGILCLWDSYHEFKEDMQESFLEHVRRFGLKDTTIDRLDSNDNYYKENCRWATRTQQLTENRRDLKKHV